MKCETSPTIMQKLIICHSHDVNLISGNVHKNRIFLCAFIGYYDH